MATAKTMGADHLTNSQRMVSVCAKEQRLLEELRKIPFGKVEIVMVDGLPDRIVRIEESVKL